MISLHLLFVPLPDASKTTFIALVNLGLIGSGTNLF